MANSALGGFFHSKGKLKEAIDHYKKALSVKIDLNDTFCKFVLAKLHCCDWEELDECY